MDIVEEKIAIPGYTPKQLIEGFTRFYFADQRSEYIYYSEAQVEEAVKEMVLEFVQDLTIPVQQTFAGKVAQETGLELIGEPHQIISHNWSN